MHHYQRISRNTLWLQGSEIVSRVVLFLVVVRLANYLGDTQFGMLSVAFAIGNLVLIVADFGFAPYVVRESSKHPKEISQLLAVTSSAKIFLILLAFIIMLLVGALSPHLQFSLIVMGGAALLLMHVRMFLEAFFRGMQKMHLEALTKTLSALVLSTIILVLVARHQSVTVIALGYVTAHAVVVAGTLLLMRFHIPTSRVRFSFKESRGILLQVWPFGAAFAFNAILNYVDAAMMGFFGQTSQAGWYTAVYKPIFFLTALAGMNINAFFPVITRQWHHGTVGDVRTTLQHLLRFQMMIIAPIAVFGTLTARELLGLVFRPEYLAGAVAFQILLWNCVLIYFWSVFGNSLQALDKERLYLRGFGIAAMLNVALNLLLIPRWSLYGAAFATLISQMFLVGFMSMHLRRFVPWTRADILKTVAPAFCASGVMGIGMGLLPSSSLLIRGCVAVILYAAALFAFRGLTIRELRLLMGFLWRKNSAASL